MKRHPICGKEERTDHELSGSLPSSETGQNIDRIEAYFEVLLQIAAEVDEQSETSSNLRTG